MNTSVLKQERGQVAHATSHPTLRLNSKRFERSPYIDKWAEDDTLFGIYAGRLYPVSLGNDPIDHYWKLRRGLLLYDTPERPIDIKGPDAVRLLEHALCRRIDTLKTFRARYAIACTQAGGIIMDGVVIRLAEDHFWYVQANGSFDIWLMALAAGMQLDVEVSDPKSRVLQVQGPKSLEFLERACPGQVPEKFGYFHAGMFSFDGQEVLVSRTGFTGEMGIEIYGNADLDHGALWDYVVACGEPMGMEMSDGVSMGVRRVEAGILDYDMDINPGLTPFAAGLGNFVDMTKPDFVGKDALQHADKRCRLFGLTSETGIPCFGSTVLDEGREVGRMTIGDWSPTVEMGVGYVVFDEPENARGSWLGQSLTLRDPQGELHDCVIVNLPFFDAEKRIPRGLEPTPPAPASGYDDPEVYLLTPPSLTYRKSG